MKFAVKLTKQADDDFRSIYEYIAFELQSQKIPSVNYTE